MAECVKTTMNVCMPIFYVTKEQNALIFQEIIVVSALEDGIKNLILYVTISTNVILRLMIVIRSGNQLRCIFKITIFSLSSAKGRNMYQYRGILQMQVST